MMALAIDSPMDYWGGRYFYVHMIQHVFLMFLAPALIVLGAPWIPLMFALPVITRRRLGRFFYLSRNARGFRALGRLMRNPWFAFLFFNFVMLFWHVPAMFDVSQRDPAIHVWLMHGSFIVAGVLFWLQIIPSYPMKPAKGPVWQAGSILATNVIMTMLAMSMSILTAVSWYKVYAHVPGVTMSPFADQQIGGAILWVCGDFWALPGLTYVIRRAIKDEGSFSGVVDRFSGRSSTTSFESFYPPPGDAASAGFELPSDV